MGGPGAMWVSPVSFSFKKAHLLPRAPDKVRQGGGAMRVWAHGSPGGGTED